MPHGECGTALDSLMSGLEVDFIMLVKCLVSRDWRLLLAADAAAWRQSSAEIPA